MRETSNSILFFNYTVNISRLRNSDFLSNHQLANSERRKKKFTPVSEVYF